MTSEIQRNSHDCATAKMIENTYQEKALDETKIKAAERLAKEKTLGWWGRTKDWTLWTAAKTTGVVSESAEKSLTDYRAADIAHSVIAKTPQKEQAPIIQ